MASGSEILDLSRVLLSEEISRVRRERWSGVLALTQGEVAKGIYFVDGAIAFAASTVEEDRLGANLFRIGKITEPQFRAAMRGSEGPGHRLGQALIEAGVLTPEELAAAVTGQVERIVLSVLRWTSGQLRREAMDRPIPADCALDLQTNPLVLLGCGSSRTWAGWSGRWGPRNGGSGGRRRCRSTTTACRRLPRSARCSPCAPGTRPSPTSWPCLTRGRSWCDRPTRSSPRACSRSGGASRSSPPARARGAAGTGGGAAPEVVFTPPPHPPDPEEGEQMARLLLEKGHRPRAIAVLTEVLERHPEAQGCRRLLAMTLAQEGGFDPAVERHFLTALEKQPDDVELRYRLATYYRRAGMSARALLQLRLVLSVDSGHAGAWRDLGELEAGEGRRGR